MTVIDRFAIRAYAIIFAIYLLFYLKGELVPHADLSHIAMWSLQIVFLPWGFLRIAHFVIFGSSRICRDSQGLGRGSKSIVGANRKRITTCTVNEFIARARQQGMRPARNRARG